MKFIVDLPDNWEENVNSMSDGEIANFLYETCRNGIALNSNATNGYVIRTMFPNAHIYTYPKYVEVVANIDGNHTTTMQFHIDWWYAPYVNSITTQIKIKTLEEIRNEMEFGDIYTTKEFKKYVDDLFFIENDGCGYYHDGVNETRRSVWDSSEIDMSYPYVCWYNK